MGNDEGGSGSVWADVRRAGSGKREAGAERPRRVEPVWNNRDYLGRADDALFKN